MKLNRLATMLTIFALALVALPSQAQGLGGLLKKAKETVKTAEKTAKDVLGEDVLAPKSVTENGIKVTNPLKKYMEVEPVALYGVSENDKFGNVYLVLKVTNNTEVGSALFGSVRNNKYLAVSNKGKSYFTDNEGAMRHDTPSDIMVEIKLDDAQSLLRNVPTSLTEMQTVKLGILLDANRFGYLTFKNVPIIWDEEPEE